MTVQGLFNKAEQKIRAKEVFTVVDANGEVRDDVKVVTPEMQEATKKRKHLEVYRKRTDTPFTLVNMESTKEVAVMEQLNTKELGYFLVLQTYVDYENMLKMPHSNLPMTEKELGKALRVKQPRTYKKVLNKFIEIGLMFKKPVTLYGKEYEAFFIAKKYCFRGSSKSDKVVKVFIGSLKELYKQEEIKPADIGFLYKLLPYMHYESNHLVKNPYERDYARAQALSQRDVVLITGLDEKNVKKHLRMKLSGVHVFGTFKAGKNTIYKVNPSLFFRGIEPTEELRADFTLTGQSL
ncbi:hypothetical protein [Priestia megaterium]|uniref:hypothetical protein n=1 Tax=Priestia megaterium TaxID=1404 RepID=UPI00234EF43C|nr:hypothetical protein [Priestia megaterium]MDC7781852.1 hypothetical protein [Priestia megaterium]